MRKSLFCLLALFSMTAFAKDEGVFDLDVHVRGETGDIIGMLEGWSCTNSTSNNYQEYLANHKGEKKFFNRAIKTESKSFWNSDVESEFRKDMSISSKIVTEVSENCSRTYLSPELVTSCDVNGQNCTQNLENVTRTEYLNFTWTCEFENFPTVVGQSIKTRCNPHRSDFGSASYINLTRLTKSKEITARLTLKDRHESFAVDLCKGRDLKTRKIIKLTQGLDSLALEDDFVVTIEIPGLTNPIKLYRENGVFNDEIAICRNGDIPMTVKAVEVDPIWDDIYSCDAHANEIVLSTRKAGKSSATINFKRDNTWDKMFLDKKQQLKFEIRESPIY